MAQSSLAQDWQPYTVEENLARLVSDTILEGTLRGNVKATGRYNSDGTGVLEAWADRFPRRREIRGDEQICIEFGQQTQCTVFEKAGDRDDLFRATAISTGETAVFSVQGGGAPIAIDAPTTGAGGAVEPSADEIAKSLANPNTPLAGRP